MCADIVLKLFLLLLLVGCPLPKVEAQNITVCDAANNATCQEENRICLSTDGNQTCGNCMVGYIEFRRNEVTGKDPTGCKLITSLVWKDFHEHFQPKYADGDATDELFRLARLTERLEAISAWQAQIPPPPYQLGPNEFAADTDQDRSKLLGYRYVENAGSGFKQFGGSRRRREQSSSQPDAVDWEAKGGTTSVKNQGRCGCCWTISTTGQVEGATFVTDTYLQSLSFQQLISCDTQNKGCDGGNIALALKYSVFNEYGGLDTAEAYPFKDSGGTTSETCELPDNRSAPVRVTGPETVVGFNSALSTAQRIEEMKAAVAQQPVSITMMAECDTIMNYDGGVLTTDGQCACQDTSCIDHAILLVGYNDSANPPYWKIKNSWGASWGESGYFRVAQEGGGAWGLFGILGEGYLAQQAMNTTGEVEEPTSGAAQLGWNMATGSMILIGFVTFGVL